MRPNLISKKKATIAASVEARSAELFPLDCHRLHGHGWLVGGRPSIEKPPYRNGGCCLRTYNPDTSSMRGLRSRTRPVQRAPVGPRPCCVCWDLRPHIVARVRKRNIALFLFKVFSNSSMRYSSIAAV